MDKESDLMISRVIGFEKGFPLSEGNHFETYEVMLPKLNKFDLVIKNLAVSINPVDTKLRQSGKGTPQPHILGFDSVGIVTQLGSEVKNMEIGDRVFLLVQRKDLEVTVRTKSLILESLQNYQTEFQLMKRLQCL